MSKQRSLLGSLAVMFIRRVEGLKFILFVCLVTVMLVAFETHLASLLCERYDICNAAMGHILASLIAFVSLVLVSGVVPLAGIIKKQVKCMFEELSNIRSGKV